MKRYDSYSSEKHESKTGEWVLFEDAEAYATECTLNAHRECAAAIKAAVEAEREEIIELIRMLSGIQLMQAIRARGAKA